MPDVQHNTLTAAEIHEPKGIGSALQAQKYIADGAGSGTWTYSPTGWGQYAHNGAAQVFNTTPSQLVIDGLASTTNTGALPREIRGTDDLWDTTTNRITPVAVNDVYSLRLDLPLAAKAGSPTELTAILDIQAGTTYANRIAIVERYIPVAKAVPFTVSFSFPVYTGSTFKPNGGLFWFFTDTGSITLDGPSIFLSRIHGEY